MNKAFSSSLLQDLNLYLLFFLFVIVLKEKERELLWKRIINKFLK